MSDLLEALILGIIQGLTEFLPVSSSGHLEIAKHLLHNDQLAEQSLMTSVVLHFATALATVVVFYKEIKKIFSGLFTSEWNDEKWFSIYIIVSMIPAAIVGFFFEDYVSRFFSHKVSFVGAMLIVTAVILYLSEKIKTSDERLSVPRAFIIGLSQALALLPGISRSGATIGTGLLMGLQKESAARFSFLMVVPLILGKMAYDLLRGDLQAQQISGMYLAVGFVSAFIAGIFACKWMIRIVRQAQLKWFALYCFLAGTLIILTSL